MLPGVLLGCQGATRSNCKPSKIDSFGCHFTPVIVVENQLHPYAKLTGQLAIDLGFPIEHSGLRIQLEALCVLKFETKIDNRTSFHKKYTNLLEGTGTLDRFETYLESPVFCDVLEPDKEYVIPAGNNRFRFQLQATGEFLPAPFKSRSGSLTYKLVAYLLHGSQWVDIGEKELKFNGYYNLTQNIDVNNKAIQIERSIKKSIFSTKKVLTATLNLESCGYLPNEELPFTIHVETAKCLPIKMWIALSQKVTYNIDGAKKTTIAVIDSAVNEILEPGTESVWTDTLKVHRSTAPTYSINQMYNVSHQLQFKVKVEDYGTVKADVPIFIGTTREPVELLMITANSLNVLNERFPARRGSASSIHSECSTFTVSTLPPAYSQLSSRIPSLETLPPPYEFDDEDDFRGLKEEHRNLSGLGFHVVPPDEKTLGNGSQHDRTPATSPTPGDDADN